MAIATKAGTCCVCGERFEKGELIRFEVRAITRYRSVSGSAYTVHKPLPRHTRDCHREMMVRMYLASIEERRAGLRRDAEFMRESIGDEAFEARRERFAEFQRPKFEALDAEEAHIRQYGHPYPEEVAYKARRTA